MSQKTPTRFDELYRDAETHDDYWLAGVVQQLTEEVFRRMEELKLTRAELARRLGSSPAYVTKILRGNANFTLASLTKLARALDTELEIGLKPSTDRCRKQPVESTAAGGPTAAHQAESWAAKTA